MCWEIDMGNGKRGDLYTAQRKESGRNKFIIFLLQISGEDEEEKSMVSRWACGGTI
jgi:hypothetical protein